MMFSKLFPWFDTQCIQGIRRIFLAQMVIFGVFWVGGFFTPLQHTFFYLDYLYLPFLFRLHWLIALPFVLLFVLFDLYFSIDSTNGLSLIALLGLVREIPNAGLWGYQLAAATLGLLLILVFWVARQYYKISFKAAFTVFVVCALMYIPAKRFNWPIVSTGLTAPVFYAVFKKDTFFFERLNPRHMAFTRLAQPSLLKREAQGADKIVSIIFESYGIDQSNPKINAYFQTRLEKNLPRRSIHPETVLYYGSTVNGELRELCSVKTEGVMLKEVPAQFECIPKQLAKQGYQTLALHNNKGGFYDRSLWYPNIGFQTFIDRTVMLDKGYRPSQFAFGGIADAEMAKEIDTWLNRHPKSFVHWITLDSHGPYNQALAPEVVDCKALGVNEAAECHYVNMLDSTFSAIIFLAKQHPEAKIVVSGDHAPHFESVSQPAVGKRLNAKFSRQIVPAFVIAPQQMANYSKTNIT